MDGLMFDALNIFKNHDEFDELQIPEDYNILSEGHNFVGDPDASFEGWTKLPYDLVIRIIEKMDVRTRFRLAATSKKNRKAVGEAKLRVKKLKMQDGNLDVYNHYRSVEDYCENFYDLKLVCVVFECGFVFQVFVETFENRSFHVYRVLEDIVLRWKFNDQNGFEWIVGTALSFAKYSRPIRKLDITPKSTHFYMPREWVRELMAMPSMSKIHEVILYGHIPQFTQEVLRFCRPKSLLLSVGCSEELRILFSTCPHIRDIDKIRILGCELTKSQFFSLRSTKIFNYYPKQSEHRGDMAYQFLLKWIAGLTTPGFRYFALRDVSIDEETLFDSIPIQGAFCMPPVPLESEVGHAFDEAKVIERWRNGEREIAYVIRSDLYVGFFVPQVVGEQDNGDPEYERIPISLLWGNPN